MPRVLASLHHWLARLYQDSVLNGVPLPAARQSIGMPCHHVAMPASLQEGNSGMQSGPCRTLLAAKGLGAKVGLRQLVPQVQATARMKEMAPPTCCRPAKPTRKELYRLFGAMRIHCLLPPHTQLPSDPTEEGLSLIHI